MAFNPQDFLAEVLKDVQIDESQRQALSAALTNPVVAKRIEDSTLRQSDYSKNQQILQDKIKKSQDYWDSLVDTDKKLRAREEELNRLAGETPGLNDPASKPQAGVTEEKLREIANQSIAYQNAITKIAMNHFKEFGEILNLDDVVRVSAENGGININLAYDKYVAPKREEANQQKTKELIAQAREEGKREAEANYHPPTLENPMGVVNPALDALNKAPEKREEFGSMAAVKAWKDARAKGTPIASIL